MAPCCSYHSDSLVRLEEALGPPTPENELILKQMLVGVVRHPAFKPDIANLTNFLRNSGDPTMAEVTESDVERRLLQIKGGNGWAEGDDTPMADSVPADNDAPAADGTSAGEITPCASGARSADTSVAVTPPAEAATSMTAAPPAKATASGKSTASDKATTSGKVAPLDKVTPSSKTTAASKAASSAKAPASAKGPASAGSASGSPAPKKKASISQGKGYAATKKGIARRIPKAAKSASSSDDSSDDLQPPPKRQCGELPPVPPVRQAATKANRSFERHFAAQRAFRDEEAQRVQEEARATGSVAGTTRNSSGETNKSGELYGGDTEEDLGGLNTDAHGQRMDFD